MPRIARVVVPGLAHHVTQRGNNHEDVFFTDDDRRFYLRTLDEQARLHGVDIVAYCLMTNHVHLVVVPRDAAGLELAVGRTHWRYTQAINRLHGRSGHLWQGRFFSCPLDDEHALAAVRYVERNPVRARIVRLAERYPWSTAAVHCGVAKPRSDAPAIEATAWLRRYPPATWQRMLREPDDEAIVERRRAATRTGRPAAADSILSKLETKLNRRLRALPQGRPPKPPAKAPPKASATKGSRASAKAGAIAGSRRVARRGR
jgi:putative transposase